MFETYFCCGVIAFAVLFSEIVVWLVAYPIIPDNNDHCDEDLRWRPVFLEMVVALVGWIGNSILQGSKS